MTLDRRRAAGGDHRAASPSERPAEAGTPGSRPGTGGRSHRLRWAMWMVSVFVLVAAVEYGVAPQIAGAERILRLMTTVNPWWVTAGLVLEACSLISYSHLSLRVLGLANRRIWWMLRTDLSGLAVSHLVPGGAAAGNAVRYRLLRTAGYSADDAGAGVTVEGIGSTLALLGLLWISLAAALLRYGPQVEYAGPVVAGLLLVAAAWLVDGQVRNTRLGAWVVRGATRALPSRIRPRIVSAAREFGRDVIRLLHDRRVLRECAVWAVANWCCDAASLWFFLAAFDARLDPVAVLVVYTVANVIGLLPVTPGGLGLIEGVLIPGLLVYGAPAPATLLGVLSWRLFEFWVPIPVGGISYLTLRVEARFAPTVSRRPS